MSENFENNVYMFITELRHFYYRIESTDKIWDIIFPTPKGCYHYLRLTKYEETFNIAHMDGKLCTLEVRLKESVKAAPSFGRSHFDDMSHNPAKGWNGIISSAYKWLKTVKKDWVKANRKVQESYPLKRRYGIVSNALVQDSLQDIYRIDHELGKAKTKKFISLVEKGYFRDRKNTERQSLTANEYFEYCKIAYIAGKRKDDQVDEKLSGRQMYERYADGRDDGLLDIDGDSKEEFADWIDGKHAKKSSGGHPWEIKRGGNTTHIDLYVSRPSYYKNEGFALTLKGQSIGRLKETICMFLGIYEAGLPITIYDPEGFRKRLLGLDNIGIVPCYDSLHRANQRFHEHKDVYDVIHYDDLGRYKRRILPFITWEPLPLLKPVG